MPSESDAFLNQKPNKQTMDNRGLFIAAVFNFVYPVEKTVKKITSWHKTLSAPAVKVNKFQDAA